jgi:predicted negative regulator of RcsB-dependent stress response
MSAMSDDEQKEQLKSFAKSYALPIVAGIVIALGAFFAWQWYQQRSQINAANLTVQYQNLLNQAETAAQDGKVYSKLMADGDKLVAEHPNSTQALQAQLLMAKLAFDKKDYAKANSILTATQNSKIDDQGLVAIAKLHLAYTQMAQNQLDAALKTLEGVKLEAFVPSIEETKGDIYVAQHKFDAAKKAYQQAWDVLVKRQQPRELLQIKLANLGVLVEDPKIQSPILTPTQQAPASSPSES